MCVFFRCSLRNEIQHIYCVHCVALNRHGRSISFFVIRLCRYDCIFTAHTQIHEKNNAGRTALCLKYVTAFYEYGNEREKSIICPLCGTQRYSCNKTYDLRCFPYDSFRFEVYAEYVVIVYAFKVLKFFLALLEPLKM